MKFHIFLISALAMLSETHTHETVAPAGIIIEKGGMVTRLRNGTGESSITVGEDVLIGDIIYTKQNSWVVISLPRSTPANVRITENASWKAEGDKIRRIPWGPTTTNQVRAATSRGDKQFPTLLLPRRTKVFAVPFRMSWAAEFPSEEPRKLLVSSATGETRLDLLGTQHVEIPAGKHLESGRPYCWQLSTVTNSRVLAEGAFSILSNDELARIQKRIDSEIESMTTPDYYASMLVQLGIFVDEEPYLDAALLLNQKKLNIKNYQLYESLVTYIGSRIYADVTADTSNLVMECVGKFDSP